MKTLLLGYVTLCFAVSTITLCCILLLHTAVLIVQLISRGVHILLWLIDINHINFLSNWLLMWKCILIMFMFWPQVVQMLTAIGAGTFDILLDTSLKWGKCLPMGSSTCEPTYTSRLDTGFTWCMLHFFSVPSGVVSETAIIYDFYYMVVIDVSWIEGAFVMVPDKQQLAYLEVCHTCDLFISHWFCRPIFC